MQCETCENGTSRGAETAVQDLPKPHTSKKEIRNTENSFTEESSFIGRTRERAELQEIERRAEFQDFVDTERNLLDDCLHWLYYCSELHIGNCTYPQDYVREKLWGLTFEVAEAAVLRIQANDLEIRRNAIVYAAKVLFSCLMESRSEEMLDPVANRLKRRFST